MDSIFEDISTLIVLRKLIETMAVMSAIEKSEPATYLLIKLCIERFQTFQNPWLIGFTPG